MSPAKPKLLARCPWASDDLMAAYHDAEWGVPVHDDNAHFELITLEGAQAGLSWRTVLNKRDAYRNNFAQFNPTVVARFTTKKIDALMGDAGLIRHRGKIESVVSNAKALLLLQKESTFDDYLWSFVGGKPIINTFTSTSQLPAKSAVAEALSKDLKKRGFRFVGPTICYAYLQAAGLTNDHLVTCPRWQDLC